jgi:hypothetical protein
MGRFQNEFSVQFSALYCSGCRFFAPEKTHGFDSVSLFAVISVVAAFIPIQYDYETSIPMMCAAAGCYDDDNSRQMPVLTMTECERYLREINQAPNAPHPATSYRQKWYDYYGRDRMITCEVDVGHWHYDHVVIYYRRGLP